MTTAAVSSAVVGPTHTGDTVGTAVVALVVENVRGELAFGTLGAAGGLVGPAVVGTAVEVLASEAAGVQGAIAGLASVRARFAGRVGALPIIASGAILNTNVVIQKHPSPSLHITG